MENGHFTRQEILSQPEAWTAALEVINHTRAAIEEIRPDRRYGKILFTGCGSTYYLGIAAAALTQELTGISSRAIPASELWLSPRTGYTGGKTLLAATSRSGETTETLNACTSFLEDKRGDLITLCCDSEAPLAKMGTLNIVLPSGQEQSVAQTRAFSTLYLGATALGCLWAKRDDLVNELARLPEAGRRLLEDYAALAAKLGSDGSIDRFYWLGSGARHGLACELSLKMKEMSLSHSEPFHTLEFRHGPKSMVTPSTLVIGLQSTVNREHEAAVMEDVHTLGGRTLVMAERDAEVRFEAGLEEVIQNVLYLPVGQLVAFERALSKGLNPDQPTNLDSVVRLPPGKKEAK